MSLIYLITFILTCSTIKKYVNYECGYNVMQGMSTIVRAGIDRGWDQVKH